MAIGGARPPKQLDEGIDGALGAGLSTGRSDGAEQALGFLRSLITDVVIYSQEDGSTAELAGVIGSMAALTFASECNKPAALGDGLNEQVKLAAGAGFAQERTEPRSSASIAAKDGKIWCVIKSANAPAIRREHKTFGH